MLFLWLESSKCRFIYETFLPVHSERLEPRSPHRAAVSWTQVCMTVAFNGGRMLSSAISSKFSEHSVHSNWPGPLPVPVFLPKSLVKLTCTYSCIVPVTVPSPIYLYLYNGSYNSTSTSTCIFTQTCLTFICTCISTCTCTQTCTIITFGCLTKALAIAILCFCPPDIWTPFSPTRVSYLTKTSNLYFFWIQGLCQLDVIHLSHC